MISHLPSASLARVLDIEREKEFFEYYGVLVGIIGKTEHKSLSDLAKRFEATVGHRIKIWEYGSSEIPDQRVALVACGGNDPDVASLGRDRQDWVRLPIDRMALNLEVPKNRCEISHQ